MSPEAVQFSGECSQVVTRTVDGDIAFLDHHAAFIGALDIGETQLWAADGVITLAVNRGFVEVSNNVVTILSDEAFSAEEIDTAQAQEDLAKAEAALSASDLSEDEEEALTADRKWAQIRLSVAERSA